MMFGPASRRGWVASVSVVALADGGITRGVDRLICPSQKSVGMIVLLCRVPSTLSKQPPSRLYVSESRRDSKTGVTRLLVERFS